MRYLRVTGLLMIIFCIQGCQQSTPNFQHMTLPKTANYYLVCPKNYCNVAPGEYSPVYPVPAEELFNAWNQVMAQQSGINFVYSMPEQGQYQLVQHSWVLGLPGDITVQFIALSDTASTLAIFSKSRYGFYDFGTNKQHVLTWLQQLNQIVEKTNKHPA